MIYIINKLLILIIKILNKLKSGFALNKKLFSSLHILERNYPKKQKFNFIQIGANDGVSFDFLYDFVIQRISQGVVIEPVKDYFYELEHNYKDFNSIIKVNKAVHPFEKSIYINKIDPNAIDKYPDWVKGIASLDSAHHLKTGIDTADIIKELIKADSLMNILNDNLQSFEVDYFQIDTEGFDLEVLKMIDFKIINPKIIKFESVNLSTHERYTANNLLINQGYFLFHEHGDTVGIDLKNIKLY